MILVPIWVPRNERKYFKMEITYSKNGDYLLPDLSLENKNANYNLGKYALLKLNHLKTHKKTLYLELLNTDKLAEYLNDIQLQSEEKLDSLINQLKEKDNITEELKDNNQILWIQKMNCIRNQAEEIILNELIYD